MLAFLCCTGALSATRAAATNYYVDDKAGSDQADGRALSLVGAAGPWKTLAKVNATVFQPGDRLLLKAGGRWTGQLAPRGSGAAGKPIVVDRYGNGARPLVAADGVVNAAVRLYNQSFWEINALEVTNTGPKAGDLRGISMEGCDAGDLAHIYIQDCHVHNVTGEARYFGAGTEPYEVGKRTGGIVFWTDTATGVKTRFTDVLLRGNVVVNNSFGGLVFKQTNKRKWALREGGANDPNWYPHTNVRVERNFFDQSGSKDCLVAILLTAVRNAVVTGNVLKEPHQVGIELNYAESCLVERNEVYGTSLGSTGTDACALDFDRCCNKTVWQYNYLHENDVGLLSCHGIHPWDFGSENRVRYNIFQNCREKSILLVSKGGPDYIHNNVFFNDVFQDVSIVDQPKSVEGGEVYITNNVFYQTRPGGRTTDRANIHYEANCYAGEVKAVGADARKVTDDPRLVEPGKGGTGNERGPAFASLDGYKLQDGSPCARSGIAPSENVKADFWGMALRAATPSIGACEPQ